MMLISGLFGMACYYQGLKRLASRHSALAEMCFPVAAAVVNWVFLGLALSPLQVTGAAVLVLANLAIHGFGRQRQGAIEPIEAA